MSRWIINIASSLILGAGSYFAANNLTGPAGPTSEEQKEIARKELIKDTLKVREEKAKALSKDSSKFRKEMRELKREMDRERKAFAKLLANSSTTEAQAIAQLRKVSDLRFEFQKKTIQHLMRIKDRLSPEQRKKLLGMVFKGLAPRGREDRKMPRDRERDSGRREKFQRPVNWDDMNESQRRKWRRENGPRPPRRRKGGLDDL